MRAPVIIVALTVGLATCCGATRVVERPVVAGGACRDLPPPPPRRSIVFQGPDAGCPEAFVGCVDMPNALALEAEIRESRVWRDEAWARCGNRDGGTAE